jgi:hypothetical protein
MEVIERKKVPFHNINRLWIDNDISPEVNYRRENYEKLNQKLSLLEWMSKQDKTNESIGCSKTKNHFN